MFGVARQHLRCVAKLNIEICALRKYLKRIGINGSTRCPVALLGRFLPRLGPFYFERPFFYILLEFDF